MSVPAQDACVAGTLDLGALERDRVCILGIGNRERGDDAAGSLLAESLHRRTRATAIDAGAVPENHLGKVLRTDPDVVVIVDAVDFGAAPGTVARIDGARLGAAGLSTHAVSLGMAVAYLESQGGAEVVLIGIQPAQLTPGRPLSEPVAGGLAALRRLLLESLAAEPCPGPGADPESRPDPDPASGPNVKETRDEHR